MLKIRKVNLFDNEITKQPELHNCNGLKTATCMCDNNNMKIIQKIALFSERNVLYYKQNIAIWHLVYIFGTFRNAVKLSYVIIYSNRCLTKKVSLKH